MDDGRIERLLREGRISHEEAERLRAAWLASPEANVPLPPSAWRSPGRVAMLVAAAALLGVLAFESARLIVPRRTNLVRNGGFEAGDAAVSWIAVAPSGDAHFEVVAHDAPRGRRFGRVERAGESAIVDAWTQDLGVAPASRRLAVSAWCATRGARSAAVSLEVQSVDGRPSSLSVFDLPADSPWTPLEREIRLPDDAGDVMLVVSVRGPGRVDLDDVCVEPIADFRFAPGEELVANGDFELGDAAAVAWRHPSPPDGVVYAIEPSTPRGRVATVRSEIDGASLAFVGWSQRLDRFPTEVDLELSADVRGSASGLANVEVVAFDSAGAEIASTLLVPRSDPLRTVDWRRRTTLARFPAGARSLEVRCVVRGAGTAAFDAVSLRIPSARR